MEAPGRGQVALSLPSPLVELQGDDRLHRHGVRLLLKRDDLIHPELPGNKWRKLSRNLSTAAAQGHRTLLTFGGAYSNHIRATAAAGRLFGFSTVGVIRGEERLPLNPSLRYAVQQGMQLVYLDRSTYRAKHTPAVQDVLRRTWDEPYVLPEGGSNALAVLGCAELPAEIGSDVDVVCCPVGTGGTLAGIAGGLGAGQQAIGFAVLKGAGFLCEEVRHLQGSAFGAVTENWDIELGFHFGGYARQNPLLAEFVADFEARHGLRLDWVYVAKMMAGIFSLIEQGRFAAGTRVVAVVTGGA